MGVEPPSIPLSFSNNFWGKEDAGVAPLLQRMHGAKVTGEELKSFYSARAAIEDDYARKLFNLSRKSLGSSEAGIGSGGPKVGSGSSGVGSWVLAISSGRGFSSMIPASQLMSGFVFLSHGSPKITSSWPISATSVVVFCSASCGRPIASTERNSAKRD